MQCAPFVNICVNCLLRHGLSQCGCVLCCDGIIGRVSDCWANRDVEPNARTQTDCHLIPSDFNVIGIDYGCIFRDLNIDHVSAYFMHWIALCVYWAR